MKLPDAIEIAALDKVESAVESWAWPFAQTLLPDLHYSQSAYSAAEGADAVVIATEWEQFRALDLSRLKRLMTQPVIVDQMKRAAFRYIPIGRGTLRFDIVPEDEPCSVVEQRAAGRIFEIAINRGRARSV